MIEETGWTCPRCGHFNTRTTVCAACGERLEGSPVAPELGPVSRRVSETEIARILDGVANPPGLRERPIEGDIVGSFHAWFDGGAMRIDTGTRAFHFADGTKVFCIAPAPFLSASIELPDGNRVVVEQVRRQGLRVPRVCLACDHVNAPMSEFCSGCGSPLREPAIPPKLEGKRRSVSASHLNLEISLVEAIGPLGALRMPHLVAWLHAARMGDSLSDARVTVLSRSQMDGAWNEQVSTVSWGAVDEILSLLSELGFPGAELRVAGKNVTSHRWTKLLFQVELNDQRYALNLDMLEHGFEGEDAEPLRRLLRRFVGLAGERVNSVSF